MEWAIAFLLGSVTVIPPATRSHTDRASSLFRVSKIDLEDTKP